ncbi:hypothetical protein Xcel_0583 [Xylanimonas cellulosilytica DSM 15894]|uniref:Uncharacterized protein n=1 Tax=Xylanimonas cellulosilytica (strain DSM 15894 / JCM 12276 / CECT 5975 / KCTC 9989 / LMG 20990 / NBRC 107835 / XIL07) TaxID=446471 RepID=D1BWP0_XYLCX|nr:hypothetical protein [Xylanimonas cellulosilytica]ACZ29622.1 hypothetical protein Xcel_0583 [Xylanimonas cellulosilytica DSM 15894]
MNLRIVPAADDQPIPYDEANEEFGAAWSAARKAYADLLVAAGLLATPLYVHRGPVKYHRVAAALHDAERVANHAQEIATALAACRDLWTRADRQGIS